MGIMDWFDNPVTSITDSVVKNVFMDKVKPKVGSILKVDIGLWFANHTGIYIGNNQIVELYNDDGIATIRIVSPMKFLRGEADSLARYGSYIYCACYDDEVLGAYEIAERAKNAVGNVDLYAVFGGKNCHGFTSYCITGRESSKTSDIILLDVENSLEKYFGLGNKGIIWRSTGNFYKSKPL